MGRFPRQRRIGHIFAPAHAICPPWTSRADRIAASGWDIFKGLADALKHRGRAGQTEGED
jgi:hypothetical protein